MAIKTTLEQLEEVQSAITQVMSGQDVSVAGKRWVMADLGTLERREEKLLTRYRREQGYGLTVNTGVLRRD